MRQSFDVMSSKAIDLTFDTTRGIFQVSEEQYESFVKLVEDVQRTTVFRSILSLDFISKNLISWLRKRLQDEAVDTFTGFLEAKAAEAVQTYEIWIPIQTVRF
jgi:hypothetical protein